MRGLTLRDQALLGQGFNPLNEIPWLHAVWLNDPLWTPPGSGQPISSLRNVSGGGDPASTLTARPVQLGTTATLYAQFDGSNDILSVDITDVAQPYKVVMMAGYTTGANMVGKNLMGVGTATNSAGIGSTSSPLWYAASSTGITSAVAPTVNVGHIFRATFNGASSQFWMDEVSIATGNAGSLAMTMWSLGAAILTAGTITRNAQCVIGFCGIAPGSVSDADLSSLAGRLKTYYGTP